MKSVMNGRKIRKKHHRNFLKPDSFLSRNRSPMTLNRIMIQITRKKNQSMSSRKSHTELASFMVRVLLRLSPRPSRGRFRVVPVITTVAHNVRTIERGGG